MPAALRAQIAAVEAALPADQLGQPAPRWTLTWLEGRPIAELDTGVIVTLDADGEAVVTHDDEDGFALGLSRPARRPRRPPASCRRAADGSRRVAATKITTAPISIGSRRS